MDVFRVPKKPGKRLKQDVKGYWEQVPMTYYIDSSDVREFFMEIDRKFRKWLTTDRSDALKDQSTRPIFSKLIDYENVKNKYVLEVGCGMGTMIGQFASQRASAVGIDITKEAAVKSKKRFEVLKLDGDILNADAENLPFKDNCFSFVFSWGVLHHTPKTQQATNEIFRVLNPGGEILIMLYHRNSLFYYFHKVFKFGVVMGELRSMPLQEVVNKYTDDWNPEKATCPLAKYYSKDEILKMFSNFKQLKIDILGLRDELRAIPCLKYPFLGLILPDFLIDVILRKIGGFILIRAKK